VYHDVIPGNGKLYLLFICLFIDVNVTRQYSSPEKVSSASTETTT